MTHTVLKTLLQEFEYEWNQHIQEHCPTYNQPDGPHDILKECECFSTEDELKQELLELRVQ